jgi:hypothetical protein
MTKLVIENDTPFRLTPSSRPQVGTSWYDLPAVTEIAPGAAVYVAGLTDVQGAVFQSTWGWLYFFQDEDPSQELQVFAECNNGSPVNIYGMIGPQASGSSSGNPMPGGFAPAVPAGEYSFDPNTFVTLHYVYHGAETGLAGVGRPLQGPIAMAVFNDATSQSTTLFMVAGSPRGHDAPYLYTVSAVLPQSGPPAASLAKPSAWTRAQLVPPTWQQVGDRSTPSSLSAGALAPQDQCLYYFWNEADYSDGRIGWRFLATGYERHDANADPYWGSAIQMRDETGAPIGSGGFNCGQYAPTTQRFTPDVCAVVEGSGDVLAGMLVPGAPGGPADTLLLLRYETGSIFHDTSVNPNVYAWPATAAQRIPVSALAGQVPGLNAADVGLGLSMDILTTYPPGNPTTGATPQTWLVLALANTEGDQAGVLVLPLDADGTVPAAAGAAAGWAVTSFPVVRRDAAGRIVIMFNTSGGTPQPGVQIPDVLNTCVLASNAVPSSQALAAPQRQCTATMPGQTPSAFWWMSSTGQPADPVDAAELPVGATALRYPIYRFMAYGYPSEAAPARCAVQLTGWGEEVSGVQGSPEPPADTERLVLQGIVDGPIPVCEVNTVYVVKNMSNFDTTYNTIRYGTSGTKGASYSVSSSTGWGVKSTGGFSVGAGIAWDISVDSSTTSSFTKSDESSSDFYAELPSEFSSADGSVSQLGIVLTDTMTIHGSRFQLLEPDPASADGTGVLAATDAGIFIGFTISFTGTNSSRNFGAYNIQPGNLHSYTREAITARMRNYGYTGEDYVQDVIEPNAVPMTDGEASGTIDVTWSSGVMTGGELSWSEETFTEQGWQLNTQDFVGISGGFSTDIEGPEGLSFGLVSFEYTALAGLELSWTNESTQSDSNGWQIALDGDGLPEGSIADPSAGCCDSFDFTFYFLPASSLWTNELLATLPGTADPKVPNSIGKDSVVTGSQPWRICFVVTRINEWVDGTGWVTTYPAQ